MSLEVLPYNSREEWLTARGEIRGIGGSDAATAVGLGKRKSVVQLWREKSGRAMAKDLSGLEYVQLGVKTEGPMRELFAALHPELEVVHRPYDIYHQTERPWCFATLDGELTDRATGDMGILEIKKAECMNKREREEWSGKVPQDYFCQVLHQMLATGYSFAWLWALLLHDDGSATLKPYYFPREDYEGDLAWLAKEEEKFMGYLTTGRIPPAPLVLPV